MSVTESPSDRIVRLRERDCENCGGRDLEPLWRQSFTARTRTGNYVFDVNNVICRTCGLAFVSPVFQQADLSDYYRDSFSAFAGGAPDYDIAKRLAFLDKVAPAGGMFVEVGANRPTDFHRRLRMIYRKVETVELNDSVDCDHRSLATMPDGCVDVVTHYFVLEHVAQVMEFLGECARVLRNGGVMVCEVPDILVYPQDPSPLQLYEHTNHFSREVLRELAEQAGFTELAVSAGDCSRSFGFVAAFKKIAPREVSARVPGQYQRNRELFLAGVSRLEQSESELDRSHRIFQDYQKRGAAVILWAANDVMARFLDRYSDLGNAVIVDSNPEKANTFRPRCVFTPVTAVDAIKKADAIFVFTKLHAADILRRIQCSLGKSFNHQSVHVVDPFCAPPTSPESAGGETNA